MQNSDAVHGQHSPAQLPWDELDQNGRSRRRALISRWWRWRCSPESGWPTRQQAFEAMRACGVPVVPHGRVDELQTRFGGPLVAYQDPMLHAAEGKLLIEAGQDPGGLVGALASPLMLPAVSLRVLRIGSRLSTLIYRSDSSWMSNEGEEGSIEQVQNPPAWPWQLAVDRLASPIWAIDLVAEPDSPAAAWLQGGGVDPQGLLACDFNLAPGIQGTGLHQSLGGGVVEALATSGFLPQASFEPWPARQ